MLLRLTLPDEPLEAFTWESGGGGSHSLSAECWLWCPNGITEGALCTEPKCHQLPDCLCLVGGAELCSRDLHEE